MINRIGKIIIILIVLSANVAYAEDIIISAIKYDPAGPDSGYEWVELYNPTNNSISLFNYSVFSGNGANPSDWKNVWTGEVYDSISPKEWFLIGESQVIPFPDSITTLGLQNGPDSCQLRKKSNVIDTVGWGDLTYPEYFEGSPVEDYSDGSAIVRDTEIINGTTFIFDYDNNSRDFIATKNYIPSSKTKNTELRITVEIVKDFLNIGEVIIEDDDPLADGIQLTPIPGKSRDIEFTFKVNSSIPCNLLNAIVRIFNKSYEITAKNTNDSCCIFSIESSFDYKTIPGNYTMEINVSDNLSIYNFSSSIINILSLSSFMIDSQELGFNTLKPGKKSTIIGDLDFNTNNHPTLKNTGNTEIDIGLIASDLVSDQNSISISNVNYNFVRYENTTIEGNLKTGLNIIDLNLGLESLLGISFSIGIPEKTSTGLYSGQFTLLAIPSEK